jgi:hypothetical protein
MAKQRSNSGQTVVNRWSKELSKGQSKSSQQQQSGGSGRPPEGETSAVWQLGRDSSRQPAPPPTLSARSRFHSAGTVPAVFLTPAVRHTAPPTRACMWHGSTAAGPAGS